MIGSFRMTDHQKQRLFEIIPGASVWMTLIGAVVVSFVWPLAAIIFIVVFDLFWFFRVLKFVTFLISSWFRYRRTIRTDWQKKIETVETTKKYRHLIFLPTYKESYAVIRDTLANLAAAAFPSDRLWIVLAGEEADGEQFLAHAERAQTEFANRFGRFIVTLHPKGLADEIPGKGSNLHYAGNELKKILDAENISYEDVIVSALDIDTVIHPQYFAYLSYLFATTPNPTRASYQPIALYNNNLWDAPAPVRVAAFGTTFWLMTELAKMDKLVTFSSHSMSFKALADVGFWARDVVSEDSRIFLQCLVHYHGDYRAVPMFLPVSMDTVIGGSYLESMKALYAQIRRWALGVENFPYVMRHFLPDRRAPLRKRLRFAWNEWEGRFSWATGPILIFIMGQLPLAVASNRLREIAFVENAPFTLSAIMTAAMIGAVTSGILSLLLLPRRPAHIHPARGLVMILQWALLPITFILFGSIPAIDAQTRLMFGKYLGFNVTQKQRSQ